LLVAAMLAAGMTRRIEHRRARLSAFQESPSGADRRDGDAPATGSLRDRIRARFGGVGDASGGEEARIGGVQVTVWRPVRVSGPAPLIIFSHGYTGSSTQSIFLTSALAAHGYLVIAPNRKDSLRGDRWGEKPTTVPGFLNPANWSDASFTDRRDDILAIVKALKSDPAWAGAIDWKRFGLAGHSLGGYTVLGLAGAWPSWKMPGIKAVLALSPFCTPYLVKHTLGSIHVPVMYQGGTVDFGITPYVKKSGGAYDQTPSPAYYVDLDGAGHFAWTNLNPRFQSTIVSYSVAFFDRYVKGDRDADLTSRLDHVDDLRSK
jgi:predicted dienelactone hydrolase